jgi:hypothetical protein
MRALRSNIAGDELIDAWWRDAENWAKDLTETLGAEVGFRDAWELFTDEKFAEAKEAFELVTTDAESYEKALVYVGVCEFKLEELEAAEATFDRYLNQFLVNPVNAVHDPRRRAKRSEAESSAWFYWGLCAYREAELGQGDWGDVVAKLADFHTRFPDQPSLSPAALYRVMIAHTKLHDNASARAVYEELLESFGSSQWTGRAAKDYFEVLEAQRQAEQDPAAKEALLRQMADALQVLNANSPEPSFANMRRESRLWMDLGDWAAAEALLERIVVQFEATEAKDIDKFVRPDLGEALMRQHKVADAAEILAPLVEAKVADRDTARNYALVLSGWLDYGDGKPVLQQVAGLGGPGNLERAAQILDQITEGTEKWEPEWYRLKAEQIYVYVLWGALDGKKLETARDQIQFLITNVGAQFQDDKIDEPLRAKFAWLAKELK